MGRFSLSRLFRLAAILGDGQHENSRPGMQDLTSSDCGELWWGAAQLFLPPSSVVTSPLTILYGVFRRHVTSVHGELVTSDVVRDFEQILPLKRAHHAGRVTVSLSFSRKCKRAYNVHFLSPNSASNEVGSFDVPLALAESENFAPTRTHLTDTFQVAEMPRYKLKLWNVSKQ